MTATTPNWYADPQAVHAFATVLVDVEMLQDREAVLYFFEKPWKWTTEYLLWEEHGFPANDEGGSWAEFYVALDELVTAS